MTEPCRAASSSMSTTDIALWCFSFVTLFNLQGTRPVRLSGGTYAILPRLPAFVKRLFQLFSKFFPRLPPAFCRSLRQLIYFTRARRVCQALFSLRLKFFCSRRRPDRRVPDSLLNIPDTTRFVNTFYGNFSTFFHHSPKTFFHHFYCYRFRTQNAGFFALFRVHIVNLSYILLIVHRVFYY